MGYRNKTYVIFDRENDLWAYSYMLGWRSSENINFNLFNSHDLKLHFQNDEDENFKENLYEQLKVAKQAIVLIGDSSQKLSKLNILEMKFFLNNFLPIVVVNLNGKTNMDYELCPSILKQHDVMHVSFNVRIIQYALEEYCMNFQNYCGQNTDWYYPKKIYDVLRIKY